MAVSNIEEALCKYILTISPLTAVIGNKIEPMKIAQTLSLPFLTYELMEDKVYGSLNGCSGLDKVVYRLNCIALLETDVNIMYYALRNLFKTPAYHNMDSNYPNVAVTMTNGYHESQRPYMGSDKYPYTKSLFITLQYGDPCPV